MNDDPLMDDSSHYEISLTTGQAFVAFVLLLLSLAAAFAFGVMIGKGRAEDRLVVQREPSIITEQGSSGDGNGRIEELGVPEETAGTETAGIAPTGTETAPPTATTTTEPSSEEESPRIVEHRPVQPAPAPKPASPPTQPPASEWSTEPVPFVAQLLSTREAQPAESLAARLINAGYTSAYVERVPEGGGLIYRVRVRFPSEKAAHDALEDLRKYAPGEIWISKQ